MGIEIIFSHTDGEYELRSHPFEPCLYIYKDDEMIEKDEYYDFLEEVTSL